MAQATYLLSMLGTVMEVTVLERLNLIMNR